MFDQLIEAYLAYLKDIKRLAAGSVRDSKCTFKRVTEHMDEIRPGKRLHEMELGDFLAWLEIRRKEGAPGASLNKQLSQLRGYLDYLCKSGRLQKNVLDGFSVEDGDKRTPPDVLTPDEAGRLMRRLKSSTCEERKEKVIVLMLYGCGFRTSELCSLDMGDINMERREAFVKCGKGGIQRHIPVPEGVWTELMAYMAERGGKRGPLFRTAHKKTKFGIAGVSSMVKRLAKEAGIDRKVTPKTLRHSFATHLMDAGVNLAVIAALMGHRSPNETGVYLHAFAKEKDAAVGKLGVGLIEKEEKI